jgi:RNA polymerase sigma factor (sigma-70 family)
VDNLNVDIHARLIEECRKGNARAQFRLYNQYSKAMYNLACRMLTSREDVEDILQETFVECFENIGTFRFESTFGAWLKRILINKCINQLKRRNINLMLFETLPETIYEEEAEVDYNTEKIFKAIEMLSDGYRIVFTLYLIEGYDHSEISQILGITESTSKSQYSRAKERLRNILSKNKIYGQA